MVKILAIQQMDGSEKSNILEETVPRKTSHQ